MSRGSLARTLFLSLVRGVAALFALLLLPSLVALVQSAGGEADTLVDLGRASYPAGSGAAAASHEWRASARSHQLFHMDYVHGEEEARRLASDLDAFAAVVGYESRGENFRWVRPPSCTAPGLGCVYSHLRSQSATHLEPVARLLSRAASTQQFRATDAARWLLRLVQNVPYRVPDEMPFGVLPPALVVSQRSGDCDSKSLLYMHLLEQIGVRSVMLTSRAHAHAVVGVAVRTSGDSFEHRGTRYAYAETTARGCATGLAGPTAALALRLARHSHPAGRCGSLRSDRRAVLTADAARVPPAPAGPKSAGQPED